MFELARSARVRCKRISCPLTKPRQISNTDWDRSRLSSRLASLEAVGWPTGVSKFGYWVAPGDRDEVVAGGKAESILESATLALSF